PLPPVKRHPAAGAEHGRGLLVVEALSARWGWTPRDPGKAVFVIFTREGCPVEAIADLPMLNDIDADYAPQYVKLARILRAKIEAGQHKHGDALPASDLVQEYGVS